MNNSNRQEVLNLIEELKQLNTLNRIFDYGPIDTLALAISRGLNHEVYNYFADFLEILDKAIIFFNDTQYRVNIDRYTLGELYNVTREATHAQKADVFFVRLFETINLIVLEVIKAGIDEAYDNKAPLKGISSLRGLLKANYGSEHFSYVTDVITEYYNTIGNKPLSLINIISYLKRYRLDTKFISSTVNSLENEVVSYIKVKYSVREDGVLSLLHQNPN